MEKKAITENSYKAGVMGDICEANMAATEHCNVQTLGDERLWLQHLPL